MKKRAAIIPAFLGPPYAIIPSYITAFQSSPVMIYVKEFKLVFNSIKSLNVVLIMNFLFLWQQKYLEHSEDACEEIVKVMSWFVKSELFLNIFKFASKKLCSE